MSSPIQPELGLDIAPFEPEPLGLRGRLRALELDRRAGFLPTTHEEKNAALALLDYIDWYNPNGELRHPNYGHAARTGGQLQEVFIHQLNWRQKKDIEEEDIEPHQARLNGQEEGRRAVRSITFEFGDFLFNALAQGEALVKLKADIAECFNPTVTISEDLGDKPVGWAPFVRFFDLREVRRSGFAKPHGFDPLRTIEIRQDIEEEDRNKYVEDVYTGRKIVAAVDERFKFLANTLTIGSLRSRNLKGGINLLDAAVIDQQKRMSFWTIRLREVFRHHYAGRHIARRLLERAGEVVR